MIKEYERLMKLISNKAKFIQEQCDDKIDLRKKKKSVVIQLLKDREYDIIDGDEDYKYLTKMPIDSVIEENIQKLLNEKNEKMKELEHIKNESLEDTWLNELVLLEKSYKKYLD